MLQPVRSFAVLAVALLMTSAVPLDGAEAQSLPSSQCTVPSGTPIQLALDRARPGAVVTVCPGVYAESLVVRVGGVSLVARGSVVLDGTALVGTRHAVTLASGLQGFTLDGFEIRNYDDPLVGEGDASSGLVSFHGATGVRVTRSHFHGNAWAGVFAVGSGNSGWIVENSTFGDHGFADVHLHGARDVQVRNGSFDAGLVLSEVAGVRVVDNSFRGGGRGAIVVTPGVQSDEVSRQVVLQRNVVRGHYRHGLWMLGAGHAIVTDNTFDVTGVGMTLGGERAGVTLARNVAAFAYETHATEVVKGAFKKGRPAHANGGNGNGGSGGGGNGGASNGGGSNGASGSATGVGDDATVGASGGGDLLHLQAQGVDARDCSGFLCGVSAFFGRLFPAAEAQATPDPATLCVDNPACDVADLAALVSYALGTALNPGADARALADHAGLQSCAGQPDACLRGAFFVNDGLSPLTWTMPVPATGATPAGTLVFIDAGLRKPGEARGVHAARGPLDETWTALALCRFVVAGVPRPCAAAPLTFDFGLDVNWSEDPTRPQHLSRWRLKLPDEAPHASFDRVHGTDATLFVLDVKPHDASSPAPPDAPFPVEPAPEDPLRVATAGRAVLVCQIATTADAFANWNARRSDCPGRALLVEDIDPTPLWCSDVLPEMPIAAHATLLTEATHGWRWSLTCAPPGDAVTSDWDALFGAAGLQALADGQKAFYAATTPAQRDAAAAALDALLARVVARHLALDIDGQGMPLSTDPALLERTLPSYARRFSSGTRNGNVALWTGEHALVFGGDYQDPTRIEVYHPDAWSYAQPQAHLPPRQSGLSAVWTGSAAYVFQDAPYDHDAELPQVSGGMIVRYDPLLDANATVLSALPYNLGWTEAVWDPRDLPAIGCPAGCAYVFGAYDTMAEKYDVVLRYNPLLNQLSTVDVTLPPYISNPALCFDGRHVYAFGGIGDYKGIFRYDPLTDTVRKMATPLPGRHYAAMCVWDGATMYYFGGDAWDPSIFAYDTEADALVKHPTTLLHPTSSGAAFFTGKDAIVIGGWTGVPAWKDLDVVQRIPLGFDPTTRIPAILAATSGHDVVPLASANLDVSVRVPDGDGWATASVPGLVAHTPARLDVSFEYLAANGDLVHGVFPVLLGDRAPTLAATSVQHAGKVLVDITAADPDNLDPAARFQASAPRVTHTIPLVNATAGQGAGVLGHSVELPIDAEALAACARQTWTARSDGAISNLEGLGRLAIQDEAGFLEDCRVIDLAPRLLELRAPLVLALELRLGDAYGATVSVVDEPLRHAASKDAPDARPTLAQAAAAHQPTPEDAAVEAVAARVVLTIPASLAPARHSDVLAALLDAYASEIGVFAVEADDLPVTPDLARALERAVAEHGATVLVGAGVLPAGARAMPPQEKLMTVTGLAASPHVITVGALDATGGVASWSRRGPTPTLGPKPDFAAPSPEGTTSGAVANLLPFVEALAARGLRDPALVRAVLAGYATPTHNEDGSVGTYWDQGLGAVDLSRHLTMPTTAELIEGLRQRRGDPDAAATAAYLAQALGTTPATVQASPPGALLGAAAPPTSLLRSAVGATLLRLSVDVPALPAQAVVDFGVVNHAKEGGADFTPLDYAPLVAAATDSARLLLENAGYTGSQLDDAAEDLAEMVSLRVQQGSDVTLDATHYYLFDLLARGDFLHTTYRTLLDASATAQDTLPPGAGSANTTRLRQNLTAWAFDAARTYHLVTPNSGYATTPVTAQGDPLVGVQGSVQLSHAALRVLEAESWLMNGTSREGEARAQDAYTQSEGRRLLATLEPETNPDGSVAPVPAHKALLDFLATRAEAMRELRRAPQGPWSAAEAASGSWGQTPLGAQIGATAAALGHAPGATPQGRTLVLDALVDTLRDASLLLDRDLGDLHAPRLKVGPNTGPAQLTTDVAATQAAPLGPYVGLATMTTHNVTTYNPLTGEAVATRDVTIPVPSLLWNNPTLVWHEQWRDLSPHAAQYVELQAGDGRILNSTIVNTTTMENDVMVYLGADHAAAYQPLLDALEALDERLAADAEENLEATLGPFADDYRDRVDAIRLALNTSRSEAQLAAFCEGPRCASSSWSRVLSPAIAQLFSHHDFQFGVTNATGDMPFRHLFPGAYRLYIPYPYKSIVAQDRVYDHAAPGLGTLQGSLDDPDYAVARLVRDVLSGLPPHPSALTPQAPEPVIIESKDVGGYFTFEVDGSRTPALHAFELNLTGLDLLGVSCVDATLFEQATLASLRLPGCGVPTLPTAERRELERVVALGRCALGEPHAALSPSDQEACASIAAGVAQAAEECRNDPGTCGRGRALANLTQRLDGYVRLLEDGATGGLGAAIPWLRSPARLAATRPADFGLTEDRLLERTRALHGLAPDDASMDATLLPAVQTALASLEDIARRRTVTLVPPARESRYDHTLADGVLHHATDLVSGLDWYHASPRRTVDNTDAGPIRDLLLETAQMPVDPADAALVAAYAAGLSGAGDAELLAAFNAGLADTMPAMGDAIRNGWRANGSVTAQGVRLDRGAPTPVTIPAAQACTAAASVSPLQTPYFPCQALDTSLRPSVEGPGEVDRVQLLGALLERLRQRSAELSALDASTPEGRALRLAILTDAVRFSGTGANERWTRTEDGIMVESDGAPLFGVLYYSIPVPINEVFLARLQAEMFMENTAALLVVNANPVVSEALHKAVAATNVTSFLAHAAGDDGLDRTLNLTRLIDAAANEQGIFDPQNEGDSLLRVWLVGGGPIVEAPTHVGLDDGGVYRGLLATGVSGAYNLSTTMEFGTRQRGADGYGPDHMDVMLIYFPSVAYPDPVSVKQTFAIQNFTIGLETYIGIGGPAINWRLDHRIGYRHNVEDWKSMHAVSRMKVQGLTDDPAQEGLYLGVATFGTAWQAHHALKRSNIILPFANPWDDEHETPLGCPDTAAPGFRSSPWIATTAQPAEPGYQTAPHSTACVRNRAEAGQPAHVEGEMVEDDMAMTQPRKRFLDALQYSFNVGESEEFTRARPQEGCDVETGSCPTSPGSLERGAGGPSPDAPDPDDAPGPSPDAPPAPGSPEESAVVAAAGFRAQVYRGDLVGLDPRNPQRLGSPIIDLRGARPFVEPSVQWHRQAERPEPPFGPYTARHNYLLLDEDEARALLPGAAVWDPLTTISISEINDPALNQNTEDNVTDHTHGHVRIERDPTDHRGGVLAYQIERPLHDDTPKRASVSLLAGNGASGAGFALRIVLTDPLVVAGQLQMGPQTTARLEAWRLGGERTAGSDCSKVPLHGYVKGLFRCTGHPRPLTDETPETQQIAALLARLQAPPSDEDETFRSGSREGNALAILDEPYDPRLPPEMAYLGGMVRIQHERARKILEEAAQLVGAHEVPTDPLFPLGEPARGAKALADALLASITEAADDAVAPHLHEVTARLQPALAQTGEPPRRIVATLELVADGLPAAPAPADGGAMRVAQSLTAKYAVDEWSTLLAEGTVTETLVPAGGGAPQTRTLATFGRNALAGTLTPWLPQEGDTHTLRLAATDEHGGVFVDEVTYVVDNTAPLVVPDPANPLRSGPVQPSVQVAFTATDVRGLRSVHLERYAGNGAWVPHGAPLSQASLATGTATLSATLDTSGVAHGASFGVRLVAVDHAGNRATLDHHVTRDLEAPELSGHVLDLVMGSIRKPDAQAHWGAWDNLTGLASWSAWVVDERTGATVPIASSTATGAGVTASGGWTASLNHTYRLHVRAADGVGNERTQAFTLAEVLGIPVVKDHIPTWMIQKSGYRLHFALDVSLANFPGEKADGVNIRLTPQPHTKGVPDVYEKMFTDVAGMKHDWWNATETQAPPGKYTLQYSVWSGKAYTYLRMTVELAPAVGGVYEVEGNAANLHGNLPTLGDSTVYHYTQAACSSAPLEIELVSLDGLHGVPHDVDLYVAYGVHGHDPAAYTHAHDSAATTEEATLTPSAGKYSILVKHKGVHAVDTDYDLVIRSCSADGAPVAAEFNQRPTPEVDVQTAASA